MRLVALAPGPVPPVSPEDAVVLVVVPGRRARPPVADGSAPPMPEEVRLPDEVHAAVVGWAAAVGPGLRLVRAGEVRVVDDADEAVRVVARHGRTDVIGLLPPPARCRALDVLDALVGAAAGSRARLRRVDVLRVTDPADVERVLRPGFEAGEAGELLGRGTPAAPGAGTGELVVSMAGALDALDAGRPFVLVKAETGPADEPALRAAEAVVTARGARASHAAVVARGLGIPAVCGVTDLVVEEQGITIGTRRVPVGTPLGVDGSAGELRRAGPAPGEGSTPLEPPGLPRSLVDLLEWSDEVARGRVAVRVNADLPADVTRGLDLGADGVGLCRTERLFGGDRLAVLQRFLLAPDGPTRVAALDDLAARQRADFAELLGVVGDAPIAVRLLDPPLHEFLPPPDDVGGGTGSDDAARDWREVNPMLGTRGVRLAVFRPGLYEAQVRALAGALAERWAAGGRPQVEILVPLVATGDELVHIRTRIGATLVEVLGPSDRWPSPVRLGAMVETPRAALRAGDLAHHVDILSLGTNDLTQLVWGFSRDDLEHGVLPAYRRAGLLEESPFEHLDAAGVGELVELAVHRGRAVRPQLAVGACGEQAADPASIAVLVAAGVDHVSCSPPRVGGARLAVARALLATTEPEGQP